MDLYESLLQRQEASFFDGLYERRQYLPWPLALDAAVHLLLVAPGAANARAIDMLRLSVERAKAEGITPETKTKLAEFIGTALAGTVDRTLASHLMHDVPPFEKTRIAALGWGTAGAAHNTSQEPYLGSVARFLLRAMARNTYTADFVHASQCLLGAWVLRGYLPEATRPVADKAFRQTSKYLDLVQRSFETRKLRWNLELCSKLGVAS